MCFVIINCHIRVNW